MDSYFDYSTVCLGRLEFGRAEKLNEMVGTFKVTFKVNPTQVCKVMTDPVVSSHVVELPVMKILHV